MESGNEATRRVVLLTAACTYVVHHSVLIALKPVRKIEREIMSLTLIDIQWNLSTADTIGTTYVCPEYGGVCISGASGYISGRHDNAYSGFLAQYGHVSGALYGLLCVGEKPY